MILFYSMTFSLRKSWITMLSLEMLVMTSDVLVTCKSKYATSCLSIALKYLDLILAACLSPVLVQQYPSKCSIIPKSQYKRKQNQDHNSLFMIDSKKKVQIPISHRRNMLKMSHMPNIIEPLHSASTIN